MKASRIVAVCLLAAAATIALVAQVTRQPQDEEYAKLVKEWTTRPDFMSPLVDHLPKAPGIPTTKDVPGGFRRTLFLSVTVWAARTNLVQRSSRSVRSEQRG